MQENFRFLMISAMYENGGNTTHRFLDGHPELFVYPFESQIGTRNVVDGYSSLFPIKYRWPEFLSSATAYQNYKAIIDEEAKVRTRTPMVSKFRDWPMDMSDDERCEIFQRLLADSDHSRGAHVAAFYKATFEAWKDFNASGDEQVYVGYSPVVSVDAEKLIADLPQGKLLQIVRNPWSAYADTKKRAVPMSLASYVTTWCFSQYFSLSARERHPDRVKIVRIEDVFADPVKTLGEVCEFVGVEPHESLGRISWNGKDLPQVYPWGTIRTPTPAQNLATADELSEAEKAEVAARARPLLAQFGYENFLQG